jgi:N-acetylglutamate synthase
MRGRYIVRITPDDVGKRVTVRARIPSRPDEPSTTDTVGVLRAWDQGKLRIERRDGSLCDVAEADLVAARIVDERPRGRPPAGA